MILELIREFFESKAEERKFIKFAESLVINRYNTSVKFKPYRRQKKYLKHLLKNRYSICKASRQSGKTLLPIVYILYELQRCSDLSVAIIGVNYRLSLDIIETIRQVFLSSSIFDDLGIF